MSNSTTLSVRDGLLQYNGERGEFHYLGYPLILTKTETRILLYLMKHEGEYCSATNLCECLSTSSTDPDGLFRAHISHINEKAFAIGERHLIDCLKNVGYKISFSP